MTFAIIESERILTYTFNNTYYEHQCNLHDVGNQQIGFSDANIVEIVNHVITPDRGELAFYKERLYPEPSTIVFTIYDITLNLIVCELHVKLDEKRALWRKCRRGWTYPNMTVTLKITQDPNDRTYLWTGIY